MGYHINGNSILDKTDEILQLSYDLKFTQWNAHYIIRQGMTKK